MKPILSIGIAAALLIYYGYQLATSPATAFGVADLLVIFVGVLVSTILAVASVR
ncbi:hypothetical protein [Alteromonas macleodii]|uniref:Membrane protein n=1 Tax=Alteromonas macleodii TaxID=28108 RepID=A0AB36FL97_ALTMA|nr:hypothetical protein [Alteromonas macleodii]OES23923.1 putative membrane protein [Alteromonas macleodii]OES24101.1 putative membrane protein [Alteromonas macleodii]OES25028.1 putative membrane protein [Alteromonas macleodii]OES38704.1 putative membrane protein [Alteromonas macleodii]